MAVSKLLIAAAAAGIVAYLYGTQIETALGFGSGTPVAAPAAPVSTAIAATPSITPDQAAAIQAAHTEATANTIQNLTAAGVFNPAATPPAAGTDYATQLAWFQAQNAAFIASGAPSSGPLLPIAPTSEGPNPAILSTLRGIKNGTYGRQRGPSTWRTA